ncbi:MAG: site-2 protease family protein [Thermomicrobiales bacterium]|nr:site-2 protease family protein [Thermomicrobiales bacterium]
MHYLAIIPILAFLIVIHELGHFFAARSVGVTVEEFGIGLPPRVTGWKWKGTLWSLNWLPIGGFVRVKGEDANDREPGSMQIVSPWARGWFLIAGPLMNLLAALLISMVLVATTGTSTEGAFINRVEPDSPAASAGWLPGDRILAIDGVEIQGTQDAISAVNAHRGEEITVTIQRGNETIDTSVVPRENPPAGQGSTGITFGDSRMSDVRVDAISAYSPAAEAGLQPGDRILAINGVEVIAMAQAVGIMDGAIGNDVTLTIERDGVQSDVTLTIPAPSLPITSVKSDSPASRAELYATDEITSINGVPITTGEDFIASLMAAGDTDVEIGFTRMTTNGPVDLTTAMSIPDLSNLETTQVLASVGLALQQPSGFYQVGIDPIGRVTYESVSANQIVGEGWHQFTYVFTGTIDALQQTFSGGTSLDQLAGPIGMGQATGELLDDSQGNAVPVVLYLTMLISISLGLFNLLPIPALDGGRLMFVIIEILRGGKRVPPEKEGAVHMVGMLLLLGLMFLVAFGDVMRILDGNSLYR